MKYANIYSNDGREKEVFDSGLRDYMYLIYRNMGLALLISGLVAFVVGSSPSLLNLFLGNFLMRLIVMLAPIFVSISLSRSLMTSTVVEAQSKLYIFACLMGLSLSTIFVVYTKQSIVETFLTTALTFGGMSLYGYSTKKDLTRWESFLMMGVMGLLIASIINLFFHSSSMSYTISCVGVVIFTLYTAVDMYKLKELHKYIGFSQDAVERIAIIGSLELYLDFINIFLYLLNFLGDQRRE